MSKKNLLEDENLGLKEQIRELKHRLATIENSPEFNMAYEGLAFVKSKEGYFTLILSSDGTNVKLEKTLVDGKDMHIASYNAKRRSANFFNGINYKE